MVGAGCVATSVVVLQPQPVTGVAVGVGDATPVGLGDATPVKLGDATPVGLGVVPAGNQTNFSEWMSRGNSSQQSCAEHKCCRLHV